jgi:hypothetical protein
MPRKMSTFFARRLVLLMAVLLASTAVVAAQSGRRGGVKSSAPPTPPVASPTEAPSKPQMSSRLELLVTIDDPTGFDQVPLHIPDTVLGTCLRRLAEAKAVMPTPAARRMTRAEALKAAKAETARHVVWLQVRNEQAEYGADISTHSDQLYITFEIYEPGTAKIKESGRAWYRTVGVGNVGVSGPSSRRAVYSDYAIKETAKQAADKILNAFQIKIDGWPR